MNILRNKFGEYKNYDIIEYTLKNDNDLEVKILNLGGIVREINFKGKNRVLNYNNVEDYIDRDGYFGAIVGRVAGRISKGKIKIQNQEYELDKNEGDTCLHGGKEGFSFQIWQLEDEIITNDSTSIVLKYISPDMECGFPGEVIIYVKYTVEENNSLIIEYFAKTNKSTPITLTNHSYFNLNDNLNKDILDHILKIDADKFIRLDEKNIPLKIANVEGTPFDFRSGKKIKEDMDLSNRDLRHTKGYDHPFILNESNGEQIELYCEETGINLGIKTTEPVVILYTGNNLNEGFGVCLETQWYPDAINQEFLEDNILRPNENYYSKTEYKFSFRK